MDEKNKQHVIQTIHNEGIDPSDNFLRTPSHNTISTVTLCGLICMILVTNTFSFYVKHYLQIHGTATGSKMAASLLHLFLRQFEPHALKAAVFISHHYMLTTILWSALVAQITQKFSWNISAAFTHQLQIVSFHPIATLLTTRNSSPLKTSFPYC